MSESGQLGRIYDNDSFQSAVEDHRRTYKSIVRLYIIETKGKLMSLNDKATRANISLHMP